MAVMMAVQDSLLDIEMPLSTYLHGFTVNSCFSDTPQNEITIEMLLSHTAGFTHEAPEGNNYDFTYCPFDRHISSISSTWLKFPPGKGYAYSNLGVDLAAYTVEKASGLTFDSYLKKKIFDPLEMKYTTVDDQKVVKNSNRTEGTISGARTRHRQIPLMGSGAVFTNLSEMIRYTQFQMNRGRYNGMQILEPRYLDDMYTIRSHNYGLGTYINIADGTWYINHNGGGYGYSATMVFFPEYNLGAVMLCNKPANTFSFTLGIMNKYLRDAGLAKDTAMTGHLGWLNRRYIADQLSYDNFTPVRCDSDTLFREEWNRYTGKYAMRLKNYDLRWYVRALKSLGFYQENVYVIRSKQVLMLEYHGTASILCEYRPGLFFTGDGEALDFRGAAPIFKNVELKRIRK